MCLIKKNYRIYMPVPLQIVMFFMCYLKQLDGFLSRYFELSVFILSLTAMVMRRKLHEHFMRSETCTGRLWPKSNSVRVLYRYTEWYILYSNKGTYNSVYTVTETVIYEWGHLYCGFCWKVFFHVTGKINCINFLMIMNMTV